MTAAQLMGWSMINTTALTTLVSTANIYHGLRPKSTTVPAINYFEGTLTARNGIENQPFVVNCRDVTAAGAMAIAREVMEIYNGSVGTGIYGTQNGFDIGRAFMENAAGVIPETEDNIFNAPVRVILIYPSTTVS